MAVLIPDEEWLVLIIKLFFWTVQKVTSYHPGPLATPTADGASLNTQYAIRKRNLLRRNFINKMTNRNF